MNEYSIKDNGLRSFVPPCFCWDITNIASGEVTTASEVDLTQLELCQEEQFHLLRELDTEKKVAIGRFKTIQSTTPISRNRIMFVVEGVRKL